MQANFIQSITPKITKRYLLFIAAIFWTVAGMMLLYRSYTLMRSVKTHVWLKVMLSLAGGIIFYLILFSRISLKHITRIVELKSENPCFFSFFSIRSYLIMTFMIGSGILLRRSGIITPDYLSLIYFAMAVPLLISAFRFYYNGVYYR